MKVKDIIKSLSCQDPEAEIVFKPLYQNSCEPKYVMKTIRVYGWGGRIIIDGYDKEIIDGN